MSDVRIGLVGAGSFNTNYHQRHLLDRDDAKVTAVCDVVDANIARARERFPDSQPYKDYRALLDADCVDALVVSTPNQYHFAQCRDALERGIPVLVDKPITVTVEDAERLVTFSRSTGVILQTAFTRHFMAVTEHVRQEIRAGTLDVQHLAAVQRRSPISNTVEDGGMLHRRTVHIFDVVPWLTGSPIVRVDAQVDYEQDRTEEQWVDARLQLADGLTCDLLCIKNCEDNQDEVSIYGATHSYRLYRQRGDRSADRSGWQPLDLPDIGSSTGHFIDAVKGATFTDDEPHADPHSEDGLRAMRILEAVHESARLGAPIDVM